MAPHPHIVLNEDVVRAVQPGEEYIRQEAAREMVEIERRRALYRPEPAAPRCRGRTVIVVDDGIATGGTMKAVLKALRELQPKTLVLAVPVAPADSLEELAPFADRGGRARHAGAVLCRRRVLPRFHADQR